MQPLTEDRVSWGHTAHFPLYEAGWPVCMPTPAEARHLASVRRRVAEAVSLQLQCTDAEAVSARYGELIQRKAQRLAVPA